MTILAGDIGGTKTNVALFEKRASELVTIEERTFRSADYPGLEAVIKEFHDGRKLELGAACFGIAGPVIDGVCRTPNLPWMVSELEIKQALGLDRVRLINDLEATGHGVRLLTTDQLIELNKGEKDDTGNLALVAAGTGLGLAALIWNGAGYDVLASEGGHADFAPRNDREMKLLTYLLTRKKRISYERVLSGPGLVNVYSFLKSEVETDETEAVTKRLADGTDKAQVISEAGISGESELCVNALNMFVAIYGAQAGNMALTFKATGGVYLGGGIAPKIISKLNEGGFMEAFKDKGRLSPMVEATPVQVIMNPKTALMGAANYAAIQLTK